MDRYDAFNTAKNEVKEMLEVAHQDPWKHRSEGMRCKSCMWFNPKAPSPTPEGVANPRIYDVGRCRRHAPTMGGYPVVFVNDWCGDHRLDENRL
jgi:hypothetical protein